MMIKIYPLEDFFHWPLQRHISRLGEAEPYLLVTQRPWGFLGREVYPRQPLQAGPPSNPAVLPFLCDPLRLPFFQGCHCWERPCRDWYCLHLGQSLRSPLLAGSPCPSTASKHSLSTSMIVCECPCVSNADQLFLAAIPGFWLTLPCALRWGDTLYGFEESFEKSIR